MKDKKPNKPSAKFAGKSCELCGRKYEPHPNTGKYPRFITHHLQYKDPEVTAIVCLSCHNWLSGNGRVYNHPLKPRNMTDEQRAIAPFLFAVTVVTLYDHKLIIPEVLEQVRVAALSMNVKGTAH
jgi:hypothetical protein